MTSQVPSFTSRLLYPDVSEQTVASVIGLHLQDLQAPIPVIDVAVAKRNCQLMLDTTRRLKLDFRAHVKTHKTVQLAQLQVGDSKDIRLITSTVAEIESLLPWLAQCQRDDRTVSVLYGLPVSRSAVPRLAQIASVLGEESVAMIVDHPDQIKELEDSAQWSAHSARVYVKIDVGYNRAGVLVGSDQMLAGFYAHMGHSYALSGVDDAVDHLSTELEMLRAGAQTFLTLWNDKNVKTHQDGRKLALSLGASPTATATQNLLGDDKRSAAFQSKLDSIKQTFNVEIHAGVYPLLDMQQLATRARPERDSTSEAAAILSFASLGIRMLVEVVSVYDNRNGESEALVAAGSIALGREPCKSYPGWGVVCPGKSAQVYDPEGDKSGWIVDRISQEHGVLRWHGSRERFWPVHYGQKLMLWPNHACMAGPNFSFYAVVDSESTHPERVMDTWTRCRGW